MYSKLISKTPQTSLPPMAVSALRRNETIEKETYKQVKRTTERAYIRILRPCAFPC